MPWNYDEKTDVLYISFGRPREAVCLEPEEGVLLRVDSKQDDLVVGITILDVAHRIGKHRADPETEPCEACGGDGVILSTEGVGGPVIGQGPCPMCNAPTPGPAKDEIVFRVGDKVRERGDTTIGRVYLIKPDKYGTCIHARFSENVTACFYAHQDKFELVERAPKAESAQQHGFELEDVVSTGHYWYGRVAEFQETRAGCMVRVACVGGGAHTVPLVELTPVHRCRDHKVTMKKDGRLSDEFTFYLPNPSSALGEPFLECSEEPYPVGTWVAWYNAMMLPRGRVGGRAITVRERGDLEIDIVQRAYLGDPEFAPTRATEPRYTVGAGAFVWHHDIKEARLPKHIKCKDCGQAYIVPKEESNA